MVDAQTGEVRVRLTLLYHISDATYNVFTSDSPSPFSPGLQTPALSAAAHQPLSDRYPRARYDRFAGRLDSRWQQHHDRQQR